MAKTNFSKVEDILNQGLEHLTQSELLLLADKAASMGDSEQAKAALARVKNALKQREQQHWISSIKRNLAYLQKRDKDFLKSLKVKKKELEELMGKPAEIDEKGWEMLKLLSEKLDQYRADRKEEQSDEGIVEAERLKHINKRLNVNDKWLPLR